MAIKNSDTGGPNANSIFGRIQGVMKGISVGGKAGGPVGAVVGGVIGGANKNNAIAQLGDRFGGGGGGVSPTPGQGISGDNSISRRMDDINPDMSGAEKNGADPGDDHSSMFQNGLKALHQVDMDPSQKEYIAKILTAAQTHGMQGYSSDHLFDDEYGSVS